MRPTTAKLLGAIVGLAAMSGCYYPGGPLASVDRYTFESTAWQPWTVTVYDTRTGEAFWSVDVPVGEQVVFGFSTGTGPNEYKPDEIVWELMERGKRFGTRNNRMPAPPSYARRVEPVLRPMPEHTAGSPRPIEQGAFGVVRPVEEDTSGGN
ncbi:MAG: hypothetical protein AAFX05_00425 [Planctomycetota bacterium]